MKRELKGDYIANITAPAPCFTHHPDEEGTERQVEVRVQIDQGPASHTIPMKRELKDSSGAPASSQSASFTHHPDEEGTERERVWRGAS